jgi:arginase
MTDQTILTPFFIDEPLPDYEKLMQPGWQLNKPDLPKEQKMIRVAMITAGLAFEVAKVLERGQRPVSIAGDCMSAIGMTAGLQRAGLEHTLIWFDAHGDFNTWETTPSGFLGGMPLAMLVGRGEQTILNTLEMRPHPETRVIFSDGRDLDPEEAVALQDSGVIHLVEVDQLLDVDLPDTPIHVHFDTDILTPEDAPAMNYPAAGGPTLTELEEVFGYLARSEQVKAVSISGWNPELPGAERTQRNCMSALGTLLGAS